MCLPYATRPMFCILTYIHITVMISFPPIHFRASHLSERRRWLSREVWRRRVVILEGPLPQNIDDILPLYHLLLKELGGELRRELLLLGEQLEGALVRFPRKDPHLQQD